MSELTSVPLEASSAPARVSRGPDNPFVGPRSYRLGERLFGREGETAQLREMLLGNRLVLLHAPSGAGKTSLVEAGVRPTLAGNRIGLTIGFRGDRHGGIRLNTLPPPEAQALPLCNRYVYSIISQCEDCKPPAERLDITAALTFDLPTYFQSLTAWSKSDLDFLHFDRFEEVLHTDEGDIAVKEEFFRQLGLALHDRRWLAIFSMRDEYVSALEPYTRFLPTRLGARFRMERLRPEAAREAIVRTADPLRRFEDRAADTLLDNLLDKTRGFVEPTILQVVCQKLWEVLPPEQVTITETDVTGFDAKTALRQLYDEGIDTVVRDPRSGVNEEKLRRWFGQELIAGHVRKIVLHERLTTAGLPNAAVDRLVGVRLITAEQRRGELWYELTHDRFIDPIIESNREFDDATRLQREIRRVVREVGAVVALVAVAIVIVFLLTYIWASHRAFPLQQGVLAYTTNRSSEIWLMEGGLTGTLKVLFPILGANPRPLSFDQSCGAGAANAPGTSAGAAVSTTDPAFSADGRLAFTAGGNCVFVETRAGSSEYRLLTDSGREPAWSHDGAQLAVTRAGAVADDGGGVASCPGFSDIYVLDARSGTPGFNVRERADLDVPAGIYQFASFSPDGQYVAFQSSRCTSATGDLLSFSDQSLTAPTGHANDIWIAYIGADEDARCFVNITESIGVGTTFTHPFWLDPGRILISTDYSGNSDIQILPVNPDAPCARLSRALQPNRVSGFSPASETDPSASPNGRFVVYQSNLFGNTDNRVIMLDSRRCKDGDLTGCVADDLTIVINGNAREITEVAYWASEAQGR